MVVPLTEALNCCVPPVVRVAVVGETPTLTMVPEVDEGRTETIALQPSFGPTFKRGTVTLALAHRALGHWGVSMRQDVEARELTAGWLINDRLGGLQE